MLAKDSRGTIVENLWQVTRARVTRNGRFRRIPKRVGFRSKVNVFDRGRPSIVLYPRLVGKQWHIHPGELHSGRGAVRIESSKYIESEPVTVVLKLEALLEQLEERDGIYCPYYRISSAVGEACQCKPNWKISLLRILQWAREGKFGPGGTWRDLPPECSCGV
jgi:hypothetical protein